MVCHEDVFHGVGAADGGDEDVAVYLLGVKGAAGELTLVVQCIELHALGEAEDLRG